MISDHNITFLDDNVIIHEYKMPYKVIEWNALLKDSLFNYKLLSLHHVSPVLDIELIISDQFVPNLYRLDINDNPFLDP